MAASDLINLPGLLDDTKCFALVRQHRWPEGVRCPVCDSSAITRDGCDDTQPCRQRYRCKACSRRFDDLRLAGHHQPLRVWVLCLYFMGRNLSNRQIALELDLDGSDVQAMTEQLRRGTVASLGVVTFSGLIRSEARLVLVGIRHETAPAYATHHVARCPKMLRSPNLRQSRRDRTGCV